MKERILSLLRASSVPLSGEAIGREIGISRVAVWKHVKALKALGYPISAGEDGYLVEGGGDFLHPWELEGNGFEIVYRERVETTMEEAKRRSPREGSAGTVVVAGSQISGRGRMGRPWESEEGGLYFTVAMELSTPAGIVQRFPLLAAAIAAEVLEELYGVPARAKWPNDVVAGEAKLGGVLLDAELAGDVSRRIAVGVGLNLNNPGPGGSAASVAGIRGTKVERRRVLDRFLRAFAESVRDPALGDAVPRWKARSATIGKRVLMRTAWGETFAGTAAGADAGGSLLVRGENGEVRGFSYADCLHCVPS